MRLKELYDDERPREKMILKGASALSNSELLAILLRSGTRENNAVDLARALLQKAEGQLNCLAGMSMEKMCTTHGVGPAKAVSLAAAFELGRRCTEELLSGKRISIRSPETVFRLMTSHMRNLTHEECWILFLDRANHLIGKEMLSRGGLDSTTLDSRIIIRKAADRTAPNIILVHNHPSGSATPGGTDINQTRILRKVLELCDITLLDHVIIGRDSWYSFADERLVQIETVSYICNPKKQLP